MCQTQPIGLLEALKLLVKSVSDKGDFLNSKDHDGGNTILHLAVMLKQVDVCFSLFLEYILVDFFFFTAYLSRLFLMNLISFWITNGVRIFTLLVNWSNFIQ